MWFYQCDGEVCQSPSLVQEVPRYVCQLQSGPIKMSLFIDSNVVLTLFLSFKVGYLEISPSIKLVINS